MPSENPNLTERGLIITDFVDRVGDPVGIVAADGSTPSRRRGARGCAAGDALRTSASGRPPAGPGRRDVPGALAPGRRRRPAQRPGRDSASSAPHAGARRLRRHRRAHRAAERPGGAHPRRHRAVRFRRNRHQHHPGRRRQRLCAARPHRPPHRPLRRSRRPGAAHARHQRPLRRGNHRPVRHVGDRIAVCAAGTMPRREGTAVHRRPSPRWWPNCPGIAARCG